VSRVADGLRRRGALRRERGDAVECPVCGHRFRRFKPDWNRPDAICWRCGSHERHRALALLWRERDLPDASFGAILCSHVLEHVDDDRAALAELRRVVAAGGWVILMVPQDLNRAETYEDPAITTPEARRDAYWQHDHVRLYGRDFADRIRAAGFDVEVIVMAEALGPAAAARHGLLAVDLIHLCRPVPSVS
jgi:SAM-dependent methyltransferase